ncbi:unnamed protein product [Polarella glacialis]|uniref:Zinc finger C3HC4 RING-type domain-containing protein n=1 Tax=Polarella glacialis TaxID=89957 RepID=A0A813E9D1_POLGL|nr:unnamed protein product [Polarella glacialis]
MARAATTCLEEARLRLRSRFEAKFLRGGRGLCLSEPFPVLRPQRGGFAGRLSRRAWGTGQEPSGSGTRAAARALRRHVAGHRLGCTCCGWSAVALSGFRSRELRSSRGCLAAAPCTLPFEMADFRATARLHARVDRDRPEVNAEIPTAHEAVLSATHSEVGVLCVKELGVQYKTDADMWKTHNWRPRQEESAADFVSGEFLSSLPCGHSFHAACISNWQQHSRHKNNSNNSNSSNNNSNNSSNNSNNNSNNSSSNNNR